MRGFRVGDYLETKDGLHKGIVVNIKTVHTENGLRFNVVINEGENLYESDIDDFYIF